MCVFLFALITLVSLLNLGLLFSIFHHHLRNVTFIWGVSIMQVSEPEAAGGRMRVFSDEIFAFFLELVFLGIVLDIKDQAWVQYPSISLKRFLVTTKSRCID